VLTGRHNRSTVAEKDSPLGINLRHSAVAALLLFALLLPSWALAQRAPPDAMANDKIGTYDWVRPQADFIHREVMIPMRDGVELYAVIVCRKGTHDAPILLSRTPYDAAAATMRNRSQKIEEILPIADAEFVNDGYIRVYQGVRGMNRSKGDYVFARPLRGPLNKTRTDHATDAYDTIDWLVNNVKINNGNVAIIGSSYLGFTALMATIDPHPDRNPQSWVPSIMDARPGTTSRRPRRSGTAAARPARSGCRWRRSDLLGQVHFGGMRIAPSMRINWPLM
jgi:hypothetical protein